MGGKQNHLCFVIRVTKTTEKISPMHIPAEQIRKIAANRDGKSGLSDEKSVQWCSFLAVSPYLVLPKTSLAAIHLASPKIQPPCGRVLPHEGSFSSTEQQQQGTSHSRALLNFCLKWAFREVALNSKFLLPSLPNASDVTPDGELSRFLSSDFCYLCISAIATVSGGEYDKARLLRCDTMWNADKYSGRI